MRYSGPHCYTLFLSGEENKRMISKKIYKGKVSTFTKPVTLDKTPKIYLLKDSEEIVYVGYASQSIGTRLGQGIRAEGLNGYHGYKWKQLDELELVVFVFEQELKGAKYKGDKPFTLLAEAIEAELVYIVRQETGQWPKLQNEIHFNNEQSQLAKKIALEIYSKANIMSLTNSNI